MYSFPNFEPVHCSMSNSNCCFLTCIQLSQEASKVICYSHLLKYLPQFVVIHTVKGFNGANEEEVDVFLELSCFFYDPLDVSCLISGSSAFSKSSLYAWQFLVHVPLKLSLEDFEHDLASMWNAVWHGQKPENVWETGYPHVKIETEPLFYITHKN